MTTITHHDSPDREDRVRSMRAALITTLIVGGLVIGTILVVSQAIDLLAWAFASR